MAPVPGLTSVGLVIARAATASADDGEVTISTGGIVAIVLGAIVFSETIWIWCTMRKQGGNGLGSRGGRVW
jgi:hypothetical protein